MHRRRFLVATGTTVSAGLAGCFGIGGGGGTKTPQGEVAQTIAATEDGYDPQTASIATGKAVKWVNETDTNRKVKSDKIVDGATDWKWSAEMKPGKSATYTFQNPGVYVFKDNIQTRYRMCGAVAVGDASVDSIRLPCGGR